jgi:hypothetical protein
MPDISKDKIQEEAITLVKNEKTQWDDATVFVTEKIAFQMRNLIRRLRKNYYGIFDKPEDPTTGREKIWVPLTESTVESVVKNIDLDTKDINFRAKNQEAIGLTDVVRNIVKNWLDSIFFGEKLDQLERELAIDGTKVWKTIKTKDEGQFKVNIKDVDLLNCYIDPHAESIQDAYRFTERALLDVNEVKSHDGWDNTDDVEGSFGHHPNIDELTGVSRGQGRQSGGTKQVDVWELWGKIPKWLISGEEEDKKSGEEVEGHIVVSGISSPDGEKVHLIETNKSGIKPYEEAHYTKVPNRWYGRGIAEKVMMLQMWINTIVNIRINRSYVSQLGLFKVRKGSGVTSQMLSRLAANGAIKVNKMDDIEQMVMKEASQSSYKDEEVAIGWAQRVTSAFEVVTGETLPASQTATTTSVQQRSAQSQFTLVKEGIGMFLQRWLKRHALDHIMKNVSQGDIVRMNHEPEDLRRFDKRIVNELISRELDEMEEEGKLIDQQSIEEARQNALEKLENMSEDRYTELSEDIDVTQFDVQVYVTNEEMDKGVLMQNLIQSLQLAPEFKNQVMQKIFDVMGLGPLDKSEIQQAEQQAQQGQQGGQQPQSGPSQQQLQQLMQQANNGQRTG